MQDAAIQIGEEVKKQILWTSVLFGKNLFLLKKNSEMGHVVVMVLNEKKGIS